MDVVGWWLRKPLKAAVAALAHVRSKPYPDKPARILVVREGGFGDLILTIPVIRTLRRHVGPDVTIDALVREQVVGFYRELDQIDRLFAKGSKLGHAFRTICQMRKRRYDVVVDLVSSPSLSFALWIIFAAPGAHRLGGDKAELKGMYQQHIELPPRPSIHFMERLRRIAAQAFGEAPLADEVPWINWSEDVRLACDRIWREITNANPGGPVVLVNLSAGLPRRTWPDAKYRDLMPRLLEHFGDRVSKWVITAGPNEPGRATDLVSHCNDPRVVPLPRTSDFRVVAALVSRVALVITPDTSLVHACSAHGTPVVMLTVAENVIAWAPWKIRHRVVNAAPGEDVATLSVDRVFDAVIASGLLPDAVTARRGERP
ncbi:MAG: glycosyltransferase family 9 protein [Candidatus Zixiibacteriota bacterium]